VDNLAVLGPAFVLRMTKVVNFLRKKCTPEKILATPRLCANLLNAGSRTVCVDITTLVTLAVLQAYYNYCNKRDMYKFRESFIEICSEVFY